MRRATTKLRALITRGKFLELPSAYDPITSRLAESLGFKRSRMRQPRAGGALERPEPGDRRRER